MWKIIHHNKWWNNSLNDSFSLSLTARRLKLKVWGIKINLPEWLERQMCLTSSKWLTVKVGRSQKRFLFHQLGLCWRNDETLPTWTCCLWSISDVGDMPFILRCWSPAFNPSRAKAYQQHVSINMKRLTSARVLIPTLTTVLSNIKFASIQFIVNLVTVLSQF